MKRATHLVVAVFAALPVVALHAGCATTAMPVTASARTPDDGRLPLATLLQRYDELQRSHGWQSETVYSYAGDHALQIRAWRTPHAGPALWVLAGIHGEEPAGPNAIAAHLPALTGLAAEGVPIVLLPLCNPRGYANHWRYPNTAERDWRKGGYSVGDSEYLLSVSDTDPTPRAPAASGPETAALTQYALRLAKTYPPLLVLDLHEDELSMDGGYIYSQGAHADDNPVGAEIIRQLQGAGIPLRLQGTTRFGEPIVAGVISRDAEGAPLRDGSIDELLSARWILADGQRVAGPAARTVVVVETPAFAGSKLALRVAAQGAVVQRVRELWRINLALE